MENKMMWSCMIQLGMRMWTKHTGREDLEFDRNVWHDVTEKLAECGCNNIVLDIGEGLIYDSHPELAAKGAYTKDEMRAEIERLKGLGIEIVPKLNFSTCHNMWMGKYTRMVSSDEYYRFCEELIDETCELFKPRLFHLGMDEENWELCQHRSYVVLRQKDLWWHDLYHIVDRTEMHGARAVIWADYARHRPEEFVEKLPKSVIPSVWYYFMEFDNFSEEKYRIRVMPFGVCEEHGFDQFPAGSNLYHRENLEALTKYCQANISKEHLLGIMQTPWLATIEEYRENLYQAAETIRESKAAYEAAMAENK